MEAGIGWCVPTPQDYDVVSRATSALRLGRFSCPPWMGFRFLLVGRGPGRVCLKVQEGK